jgi:hypothetical protein
LATAAVHCQCLAAQAYREAHPRRRAAPGGEKDAVSPSSVREVEEVEEEALKEDPFEVGEEDQDVEALTCSRCAHTQAQRSWGVAGQGASLWLQARPTSTHDRLWLPPWAFHQYLALWIGLSSGGLSVAGAPSLHPSLITRTPGGPVRVHHAIRDEIAAIAREHSLRLQVEPPDVLPLPPSATGPSSLGVRGRGQVLPQGALQVRPAPRGPRGRGRAQGRGRGAGRLGSLWGPPHRQVSFLRSDLLLHDPAQCTVWVLDIVTVDAQSSSARKAGQAMDT